MPILIPKYKNFKQEIYIPVGSDTEFREKYKVILPDPPNLKDIDGYNLSKQDQRFRRYIPPNNIRQLPKADRLIIETRERERCDYYINKGYWFFNNGNLEWCTPHHYQYVNYWYTQRTIADWRDNDRDFYYVWDIAERDNNCYGMIFLSNRREGKALDIETEIPTSNGWKLMKDIEVGDYVFGSDGKPTKVTYVSDIMNNHVCYNVKFSDGSVVKADEEHLWIVYDYNRLKHVLTTKSIKNSIMDNWQIKNTTPNGDYLERHIIDIEETTSVPVRCIAVDNEDHSYLCTKSFIVTHNTYKSLSIMYNRATQNTEHRAGIQSKTHKDGKKAFGKLVNSWRRLPYYLQPLDTGETRPQSRLVFAEPNRSFRKGQEKEYGDVLDSEIFFGSSAETEFDGDELGTIYNDEIGKPSDADIDERWNVQKLCLTEGNVIKGKGIATSTVEEMDKKGAQNCLRLWERSLLETRKSTENGQTQSGLIPYFKPADYGYWGVDFKTKKPFIDAYGYSDRELAKNYILSSRKGKNGTSLISEIRKTPLNINEAFYSSVGASPFDIVALNERISHVQIMIPKPYYKCNFEWKSKDYIDKEVVVRPLSFHDSNARWYYSELPDQAYRNNVGLLNNNLTPLNTQIYSSGCDPYDIDQTGEYSAQKGHEVGGSGGSLGASHTIRKFSPLIDGDRNLEDWETLQPITEYLYRPDYAYEFYEDMIKQCFFFGMEIFPETNKKNLNGYFTQRGYKNFLLLRPKITVGQYTVVNKDGGATSSDLVIRAYVEAIQDWARFHTKKCKFDRTMRQLVHFDHTRAKSRTVSDLAVSFGFSLLSTLKTKIKEEEKAPNINDFFAGYSMPQDSGIYVKDEIPYKRFSL